MYIIVMYIMCNQQNTRLPILAVHYNAKGLNNLSHLNLNNWDHTCDKMICEISIANHYINV